MLRKHLKEKENKHKHYFESFNNHGLFIITQKIRQAKFYMPSKILDKLRQAKLVTLTKIIILILRKKKS